MRPEIGIPIVLSIAFVFVIAFILLKIKRDKVETKKILNNLNTKKESVVNKDLEDFFQKRCYILLVYFISLTVCAISCIPILINLFKIYQKEGQSIKIILGIIVCVVFSIIPIINILMILSNINDMRRVVKRNIKKNDTDRIKMKINI